MAARASRTVNNDVYLTLGERWYEAEDDPIALLRALARLHVPWIADRLARASGGRACRILDVGCGAGLTANALARLGHHVVGVDLATPSLEVAARHDATGRARYLCADARALPFDDATFDAACAMDFLEHVPETGRVVAEIARVVRPGGLFFFHTFNRNVVSYLLVIKGVEWFVRNVPKDLHVLSLFIKPSELRATCEGGGLVVRELRGCVPVLSRAFVRMLVSGVVTPDFRFRFARGTLTGYSGVAQRVAR